MIKFVSMYNEYQNQIVIRLKEISDWMLSEYLDDSENSWSKHMDFIDSKVEQFLNTLNNKDSITSYEFGIDPWLHVQFQRAAVIQYDPFVPDLIRKSIYKLYTARLNKMVDASNVVFNNFKKHVIKNGNNLTPEEAKELHWENLVNEYYKTGCGFDDVKKQILQIINEIENYLIANYGNSSST